MLLRYLLFASLVCLPSIAAAAGPKATYCFPAGAQRGTDPEITIAGEFPQWPAKVWSSRPEISVGALEAKNHFRVTIPADAAPGIVWLRPYDTQGASSPVPFVVGLSPEAKEEGDNDLANEPQQAAMPVVMNGKLEKGGDVDSYGVSLKAGQTLVANVQAHVPLGSPMDSVLQVCTPQGLVLAQNDDGAGLDPLIAYKAPRDGDYVVRLFAFPEKPNSSIAFAGGDTFVYRLLLTAEAYVDHAMPLAATSSEPAKPTLLGWNLPENATAELALVEKEAWAYSPQAVGAVELAQVETATITAVSSSLESPQAITLPATMTGKISTPGQADAYRFSAKKGERWQFEVFAQRLHFPLDAVLKIYDATGKLLTEKDDASRTEQDPLLLQTIPADGDYTVVVADLNDHYGFRYVYRLEASLVEPDYALTLAADAFEAKQGESAEVVVAIARANKFVGPIEVSAVDLPQGVACEAVVSKMGDDSEKSVKLKLTSTGEPVAGRFTIRGASDPKERFASFVLKGGRTGRDAWITIAPMAEKKK